MSGKPSVILEVYDPAKTYSGQKKFDCGNKTINKYVSDNLKKQVRDNLSKCFVLLDQNDDDRFIGFYTLTSFAINADLLASISNSRLPNKVPCTRLVMLGIDKEYQQSGLGKKMLQNAMYRTLSASEHISIWGLYLDADDAAYDFYVSNGFSPLKDRQTPESTPMFLHIDILKDALP